MTATQERKAFIEDMQVAIQESVPFIRAKVWQNQPSTAVRVVYTTYSQTRVGLGFSKVCWPDKWNPEKGIKIATGKALAHIWQQINE